MPKFKTNKLPEPYFQAQGITLYHGDCRDILPLLPKIDLLLTDPPYGVNLGNHVGSTEKRSGLLIKAGGYEDSQENFENVVVPAVEMSLSISDRGMVFSVPPSMWRFPAPNAIGGVFIPGAVGRNKWGWSSLIHCLLYGVAPDLNFGAKPTAIKNNCSAEKVGHPTTKPIEWIRWAIKLGSRVDELILDPFVGSGTTLRAAMELDRRAIGIEISKEYCDLTVKLIKERMDVPVIPFTGGVEAQTTVEG